MRKLTAHRVDERAGLRVLVERAYRIESALAASQRGTEWERVACTLLFEAICKLQNAEQALRKDDEAWAKRTLESELAQRAEAAQAWSASGGLCQDDYEWSTMTGAYYDDRAVFKRAKKEASRE